MLRCRLAVIQHRDGSRETSALAISARNVCLSASGDARCGSARDAQEMEMRAHTPARQIQPFLVHSNVEHSQALRSIRISVNDWQTPSHTETERNMET